jgi:hypothetical protein
MDRLSSLMTLALYWGCLDRHVGSDQRGTAAEKSARLCSEEGGSQPDIVRQAACAASRPACNLLY